MTTTPRSSHDEIYHEEISMSGYNGMSFVKKQRKRGEKRLAQISQRVHEQIHHELLQKELPRSSTLILTTGSDGRMENIRSASWVEVMLYLFNDSHLPHSIESVIQRWLQTFNADSVSLKLFGTKRINLEFKSPNNTVDSEYSQNQVFFPTRFMDSHKIYGSNARYDKLKGEFYNALVGVHKSQRKSWRSRTTYHKNISLSGVWNRKWEPVQHFNAEDGVVVYGKKDSLEFGVKHGPLRYMQYTLMGELIELVRTGRITKGELAHLGWYVQDKVDLLRNFCKAINNERDFNDLIATYYYFLRIHHIIQKKYKSVPQQIIQLHFSDQEKKEFKEVLELFNGLISKMQV